MEKNRSDDDLMCVSFVFQEDYFSPFFFFLSRDMVRRLAHFLRGLVLPRHPCLLLFPKIAQIAVKPRMGPINKSLK
jgi:hypothetical protein